jgi:intraflagellar transport protein 56
MGHFYYALKAFEALEKIDSENDYEDALRGSVIGVLQMVIAGKESVEHLIESAAILKSVESSPSVIIYHNLRTKSSSK